MQWQFSGMPLFAVLHRHLLWCRPTQGKLTARERLQVQRACCMLEMFVAIVYLKLVEL